MKYPKTRRIFQRIRREVDRKFFVGHIKINFDCIDALRDHFRSSRQYAHTSCSLNKNAICMAPQIERLAEKFIAGIIWHEFGHIIAGRIDDLEAREYEANKVIKDYFGVKIKYSRDRWKLEYV